MRFLVAFLALIASLVTGFAGLFWAWPWLTDTVNDTVKPYHDISFLLPNTAEWYPTSWAALFLFAGAALGLLASLFVLVRRGKHAAVLMFLSMVGPATLSPVTLAFTGLQGFVGLICLFIAPKAPPETVPSEAAA